MIQGTSLEGEMQTHDRTYTRLVNLLGLQSLANYKFAYARDFVCKGAEGKGRKADTSVKVHTTG